MMKLNVDLSELNLIVKEMGATLSDFVIFSDDSPFEKIDLSLSTGGIEVSLSDIDFDESTGLASYQGRQVLLYIRDHGFKVLSTLDNPSNGNKFHVADCKTLHNMRNKGRFDRYIVTNKLDGKFFISGFDNDVGELVEGEAELNVCKNCLSLLNYNGYVSGSEKTKIFNDFTLNAFFETYSSCFDFLPKSISSKCHYTDDWSEISSGLKKERGFICECCYVDLSNNKNLLHVHHVNGVKDDNNRNNLKVLCLDCHRKQPFHETMFASFENIRLINDIRRSQGRLELKSWHAVGTCADLSLMGLIKLCEKYNLSLPEVSLKVGDAVFDLAWPKKEIAVTIKNSNAIRTDWEVWAVQDAINNINDFSSRLK